MPKEGIRSDLDTHDTAASLLDQKGGNLPHRTGRLAPDTGKRGKIMNPTKSEPARLIASSSSCDGEMPRIAVQKRGHHESRIDKVSIDSQDCRPSRVKGIGDLVNGEYAYVRGQQRIEPPVQLSAFDAGCGPEVRRLPQGMHARIGPSRSTYPHGAGQYYPKGLLHRALNGSGIRLVLPS